MRKFAITSTDISITYKGNMYCFFLNFFCENFQKSSIVKFYLLVTVPYTEAPKLSLVKESAASDRVLKEP
ncbi:hypothetical protein AX660_11590 [Paraglaciecola hydrolytica]|uniref:Uncharacterized protein n=1 Tax=Paraglaciecola hydrolytica TaxID=1799789 RepID=A0A136A0S7_9ALTE|nr:hypothetical protein AX660_11590 [Paraglaciecola hydrolytica]